MEKESRNHRFNVLLPKAYKNKIDSLFVKTGIKDRDRAYYAVLVMHYLDNPGKFPLGEEISRVIVKKLKDPANLKTLSLSLSVYDYHVLRDHSEINFRLVQYQVVLIFCALALNFLSSNVKGLSVSDKFKLQIKLS